MELIDRYVYAVTKALPAKQRDDIDKELRTLIDDMLEQYDGHEPYETKVKKVLLDLGDPAVLAENYRGTKKYLIGPKNYDKYLFILKTVLGAVFLGISIATAVSFFSSGVQNIAKVLGNYLGTLFSALLQAFAWITLGFAIAEHSGKVVMEDDEGWDIGNLPEVPDKNTAIPVHEPIIAIAAAAIFIIVLYFIPQFFAVYIHQSTGGTAIIPVFNLPVLKGYSLLLAGIFVLTVSKEVLKLTYGRWTLMLSVAVSILSAISTVLVLIIFTNPVIWNPNFTAGIMEHMNPGPDFPGLWANLTRAVVLVIIAVGIVDVSKAIYKGIKYNIVK